MAGRNASKLIYMALSKYLQFPGARVSLLYCYELSVYYIQFPLPSYAECLKPHCDYKYSVETFMVGRTCEEVTAIFSLWQITKQETREQGKKVLFRFTISEISVSHSGEGMPKQLVSC